MFWKKKKVVPTTTVGVNYSSWDEVQEEWVRLKELEANGFRQKRSIWIPTIIISLVCGGLIYWSWATGRSLGFGEGQASLKPQYENALALEIKQAEASILYRIIQAQKKHLKEERAMVDRIKVGLSPVDHGDDPFILKDGKIYKRRQE